MTEKLPPGLRWIGFDLDDTLHYFKRASTRASEIVFDEIERQFGVGVDDLREVYGEILRATRNGHFSQPKTSREYRAERFGALLDAFSRDPDPHLDRLLDVYDAALGEALALKPGAREALTAAKRAGLSTMVVSEGPHDAQLTTIERLGIAPSIDLLVTSAGEQASKSDGLFEKALERAGCERHEVLYVGDSVERDIAPTSALGIANVYVGDDELPDGSTAMRLNLAALARLLDQLANAVRLTISAGLQLRPLVEADAEELHSLIEMNRDRLAQWLWWAADQTFDDTVGFIRESEAQAAENDGFQAAVVIDGKIAGVVGFTGVDWEERTTRLGYWLDAKSEGRGAMTAAVRTLVDHALGVWELDRVEIRAAVENRRSRAIPERLGFRQEGTLRKAEQVNGRYFDSVVYSMPAADWRSQKG